MPLARSGTSSIVWNFLSWLYSLRMVLLVLIVSSITADDHHVIALPDGSTVEPISDGVITNR